MRNVRVNYDFYDLVEGADRKAGSTFICDDDRAEYLSNLGLVLKLHKVEDKAEEPVNDSDRSSKGEEETSAAPVSAKRTAGARKAK
ncbi:hypothetical protein [Mobilibacterium timonense]|uniref:hypothetical protein n=1 Tax=Mobilibacterium timonense TaxID=1871012 RepID=UPI000984E55B|nr:hypothetical protein [Mobilibacterium timonense]